MRQEPTAFELEYSEALTRHLDAPGEAGLQVAYELGRRALNEGVGLLELIDLHHRTCRRLPTCGPGVTAADDFIREALASFEIAQRGYVEAQQEVALANERVVALRALNDAALAVTAGSTLQDRLHEVSQQAHRLVDAEAAVIEVGAESQPRPGDRQLVVEIDARTAPARLVVTPRPGRTFGEADRAALLQLAQLARGAIDDARELEAEHERRLRLDRRRSFSERLAEITTLLAVTATPEVMVDRFLDDGLRLVGATTGSVDQPAHAPPDPRPVFERAEARLPLGPAGRQRWLRLAFPAPQPFDEDQVTFLTGVASRLAAALDRAELYRREQQARVEAETARASIESLQRFAADLAAARSRHDVARLLLDQARHRFAANIGAVLAPDHGDLEVVGHYGFEIEDEAALRRVMSRAGARPAIEEGRPVDVAAGSRRGPSLHELAGRLGVAGLEALSFRPLSEGSHTVAVLALGWARSDDVVDDGESSEALLLLAAQGFERARLGDVDHLIASTLQNEFLRVPTPARLYGMSWSARYRAGLAGTRAGGDWFDVIDLGAGVVGFIIGDVVGHGVDAAGQMAQLRSAARALAGPDPGRLLEGLDRFVDKAHAGRFASVAYVVIDSGQDELRYAVAGHPPPVLHTPDGETFLLDRASGIVLGADDRLADRDTARRSIPAGSRLVLYTDGLVERRGESIDDGLRRLGAAVVSGPGPTSPDELADALMRKLTLDAPTDDVALMVVALDAWPAFEMVVPSDPIELSAIRARLRGWLAGLPLSSDECDDIVLGVSEAAANAMEHGARLSSELLNTVSAWVEGGSLVVTVRDVGSWAGESTPDRGRGLMIMQAVFDTVDVDSSETGTVVTMSRRLPETSVGSAEVGPQLD